MSKAEKGQIDSYVQNCAIAILTNCTKVRSKQEFIEQMKLNGFLTSWEENKKHITFTDVEREKAGEKKCKIRLSKLADYYPEFEKIATKEMLENVINTNNKRAEQSRNRNSENSNRGLIDFNSGVEEYSNRIDTERSQRAAEEAARHVKSRNERHNKNDQLQDTGVSR